MAYSDFDLRKIENDFQLNLIENQNLFSQTQPLAVSDFLIKILERNVPLAQALNTESPF